MIRTLQVKMLGFVAFLLWISITGVWGLGTTPLGDITFETVGTNFILPSSSVTFRATAVNGEDAMFEVVYDDTFLTLICGGTANTVSVPHTYTAVGNYTPFVVVYNDAGEKTGELVQVEVVVREPVPDVVFDPQTIIILPGTATYTLRPDLATFTPAEEVWCDITFPDGESEMYYVPDLDNTFSLTVTHTFANADTLGTHSITAVCENKVSSVTATQPTLYTHTIANVTVELTGPSMLETAVDSTSFHISADHGQAGANYEIVFGDGTTDQQVLAANKCPCEIDVDHLYSVGGTFIVTWRVWDTQSSHSGTIATQIIVMNPVPALVFDPQAMIILPGTASYTLEPGSATFTPAEEVWCDITFPDGESEMYYVPDLDNTFSLTVTHTFANADTLGTHSVMAVCENNVSSVTVTEPTLYTHTITNVTVELTGPSMLERAVESTSFHISADHGQAGANYEIVFGDGTTDQQVLAANVCPCEIDVDHLYSVGGTFIVTWRVWDTESSHSGTIATPIVVMNPVAGLVLTADPSSVAYPNATTDLVLAVDPGQVTNLPLTNVTCVMDFQDGSPLSTVNHGDMAGTFSNSISHKFVVSGRTTVTTTVNCSNTLNHQALSVNVQVYLALYNASITLVGGQNYVRTNSPVDFLIEGDAGDLGADYEISFGDGTSNTTTSKPGPHGDFTSTHSYTTPGVYQVQFKASDTAFSYDMFLNTNIFVLNPLGSVQIAAVYSGLIPDGVINYQLTSLVTPTPTNVSCTWTFPDGVQEIVDATNFTASQLVYSTHTYGLSYIEWHTTKAFCSNKVSNATDDKPIFLVEKITNVKLKGGVIVSPTDVDVVFSVTADTGTNVTYEVNYQDGSSLELFPINATLSMKSNHSFANPGTYNVSVRAFNFYHDVTAYIADILIIQVKVPPLVVSPLLVYNPLPDGSASVLLKVANAADRNPTDVILAWTFGDGKQMMEKPGPLDLISGYLQSHIYLEPAIGNNTIVVTAFNNVSSEVAETWLVIIEHVKSQTLVADIYFAKVDEVVTFTGTAVNGSHVDYSIAYDDSTSNETRHSSGTRLRNRDATFSHAYRSPGVYNPVLTATTMFNALDSETPAPIIVQHPVPKLVLTSNTPVLTPPGLVHYTLNTSETPSPPSATNATCMLDYGSGIDSMNTTSIFRPLVLHTDFHYEYNPVASSLKPSLQSAINCTNLVSKELTDTEVVITPNIVKLRSVWDNGPAQPQNETLTTVLKTRNYANDTCFYLNFTHVEGKAKWIALIGDSHCPSFKTWTVDEFILQDYESDVIIYNHTFQVEGVYDLLVHAENSISTDTLERQVLIMIFKCDPPMASLGPEGLHPDSPRIEFLSMSFTVHGRVQTHCEKEHSFSYEWHFRAINDFLAENYTAIDIVQPHALDYNILPFQFATGLYEVTLTAILTMLPIYINTSVTTYIQVKQSPLQLALDGGGGKSLSIKEPITLSVTSDTQDPDVGPGDYEGMTFKWSCRILSDALPPLFDWDTVNLIHPGDCFDASHVTKVTSPEVGKLSIPSDLLDAKESYRFVVRLQKDIRVAYAAQSVQLTSGGILLLSIGCVTNCLDLVNYVSKLTLEARCDNCEAGEEIQMDWTILYHNETSKDVISTYTTTIMKESQLSTLIIHKDQLIPGATYTFRMDAYNDAKTKSGFTSLDNLINKSPFGGKCFTDLIQGQSMVTKFTISCQAWKDDELSLPTTRRRRDTSGDPSLTGSLEYEIYYPDPDGVRKLLSFGRDPVSAPSYLPVGADTNETLPITIIVYDSYRTPAETTLIIEVQTPPNGSVDCYTMSLAVEKLVVAGDMQTCVNLLSGMASLINSAFLEETCPVDEAQAKKLLQFICPPPNATDYSSCINVTEIWLRSYYLILLSNFNPLFPREVKQVADVMILLTSKPELISWEAKLAAIELLGRMATNLDTYYHMEPPNVIQDIAATVSMTTTDIMLAEIQQGPSLLSSCPVGTCEEVLTQVKDLMNKTINVLWNIGDVLLNDVIEGAPPTVVALPVMEFLVAKNASGKMVGAEVESSRGGFKFPNGTDMFPDLDDTICVDIKTIHIDLNPYFWDVKTASINSPVNMLALQTCAEHTSLQPPTMPEEDPLQINTDVMNATLGPEQFSQVNDTATVLIYHTFVQEDPDKIVQLFFHPASQGTTFQLYASFNETPNNVLFEYTYKLPPDPPEGATVPTTEEEVQAEVKYPLIHYLPKNFTNETGPYNIAVKVDVKLADGSSLTETNYTFYAQFVTCALWDEAGGDPSWDVDTCKPTPQTTKTKVRFKSKVFGSSFGAGLLITPNTIDFGTVFLNFDQKLLENIHVFVTLVFLILLFLILIPYARKRDRRDRIWWSALPVLAFSPSDPFSYQVDVYTGMSRGSGTKSRVFITLFGPDGSTGVVELKDEEGRENFKTGAMNRFLVSCARSLGRLSYIRVFHDNSGEGKHASWYLEKIIIRDRTTKKKFLFLSDKWFAVEMNDFKIERVLPAATRADVYKMRHLFRRRTRQHFTEDHMWLSVFLRQREDDFTRVQRLGCCFSLLYMNMIGNAVWYGTADAAGRKDGLTLGPISFTLQDLMVSIYSLLTVYPVTVLIVFLFKSSKVKGKTELDDDDTVEMKPVRPISARTTFTMVTPFTNVGQISQTPDGETDKENWADKMEKQNPKLRDNRDDNTDFDSSDDDIVSISDVETLDGNTNNNANGSLDSTGRKNTGRDSGSPLLTSGSDNRSEGDNTRNEQDDNVDDAFGSNGDGRTKPDEDDADLQELIREEEEERQKRKKEKSSRFLPFWCIYISWVLVAICIAASAFFTLLFSFQWGGDKSAAWLSAYLLSFVEAEGLIDPVKALMLAIILSLLCKRPVDDVDDFADDTQAQFGDDAGGGLDRKTLEKARRRRQLEVRLQTSIRKLLTYILFLVALVLVSYGNRDPSTFRTNEELRNIFTRNVYLTTLSTREQIWTWVDRVVVPNLYASGYYNGKQFSLASRDWEFIENHYNMRLGPPIIRQYRVLADRCEETPRDFPDVIKKFSCNVEYSSKDEDKGTYGVNWAPYTNNGSDPLTTIEQAYIYRQDKNLKGLFYGLFDTYSGGGYVLSLGPTLKTATNTSAEMQALRWMDRFTRFVSLEFNTYNANVNLFSLVSVLVEFPDLGGALVSDNVQTVKMYRYVGAWGLFALISEIIVVIFILILFVRLCIHIYQQKCGFFKEFWNLTELVKLLCAVSFVGLYIKRVISVKKTVEEMKNNEDQVVSFQEVTQVDEAFNYLLGFCLFIQTLQLLWILGFNRNIASFGATLWYCAATLRSFVIVFCVAFFGFSSLYYLVFGVHVWNYRDFLHSVYSNLSAMLNKFDVTPLQESAGMSGRVIFVLFEGLMNFIFVNMLLSLIMDVHGDVQSGALPTSSNDELVNILLEKLNIKTPTSK